MEWARLILVRHAESEWNREQRLQGHGGTGLTAHGRAQARATARYLAAAEPAVVRIVASDLQRVTETSAPIASASPGVPESLDPRLREIDVGWWSGLTRQEIEAREPAAFIALRAGKDIARGGAETERQLQTRVRRAIDDLLREDPAGTTLVVTHGGPIRALVASVMGLPGLGGRALSGVGNCSLTVLRSRNGALALERFNEVSHLSMIA